MDAHPGHEMTDAAFEHDLRALLAVDPSPEFVARVRARVGGQRVSAWGWWPPVIAVATAAATVVVGIVSTRARPEAPRPAEVVVVRSPAPAVPNVQPTHTAPQVAARRMKRLEPRRSVRPSLDHPEIMIDAREVSALRALMRGVREGRIDLQPSLAATAPSVMDLAPIADVTIEPLIISPLDEGARQ